VAHWKSRNIECMEWCLGRAAAAAPGDEGYALQQLAQSFHSSAVRIERSLSLIAESKALLAEAERLVPRTRRGEA
jgi:hypothetical protein